MLSQKTLYSYISIMPLYHEASFYFLLLSVVDLVSEEIGVLYHLVVFFIDLWKDLLVVRLLLLKHFASRKFIASLSRLGSTHLSYIALFGCAATVRPVAPLWAHGQWLFIWSRRLLWNNQMFDLRLLTLWKLRWKLRLGLLFDNNRSWLFAFLVLRHLWLLILCNWLFGSIFQDWSFVIFVSSRAQDNNVVVTETNLTNFSVVEHLLVNCMWLKAVFFVPGAQNIWLTHSPTVHLVIALVKHLAVVLIRKNIGDLGFFWHCVNKLRPFEISNVVKVFSYLAGVLTNPGLVFSISVSNTALTFLVSAPTIHITINIACNGVFSSTISLDYFNVFEFFNQSRQMSIILIANTKLPCTIIAPSEELALRIEVKWVGLADKDVLGILDSEWGDLHGHSVAITWFQNATSAAILIAAPSVDLLILSQGKSVITAWDNLFDGRFFPCGLANLSWSGNFFPNVALGVLDQRKCGITTPSSGLTRYLPQ